MEYKQPQFKLTDIWTQHVRDNIFVLCKVAWGLNESDLDISNNVSDKNERKSYIYFIIG